MVECQWDSVVLSPESPVLTCLELTFMGVTRSNSGFSAVKVFLSHLWEKQEWGKKKKEEEEEEEKEGKGE